MVAVVATSWRRRNKTKTNTYTRKLLPAKRKSFSTQTYIYIYIRQKIVSFGRELWLPHTPNQGRKSFHVGALNAHLLSLHLPSFPPFKNANHFFFLLFFFFLSFLLWFKLFLYFLKLIYYSFKVLSV